MVKKYCLTLEKLCLGEAKSAKHATTKSINLLDVSWMANISYTHIQFDENNNVTNCTAGYNINKQIFKSV